MPRKKKLHRRSPQVSTARGNKKKSGLSVSLYVDRHSNNTAMKVIDNKTLEVKKEILPVDLQDMEDTIDEIVRLFFTKKKL